MKAFIMEEINPVTKIEKLVINFSEFFRPWRAIAVSQIARIFYIPESLISYFTIAAFCDLQAIGNHHYSPILLHKANSAMGNIEEPVSFTSLGMLILDEVHLPCGKVVENVMGGSGCYGKGIDIGFASLYSV